MRKYGKGNLGISDQLFRKTLYVHRMRSIAVRTHNIVIGARNYIVRTNRAISNHRTRVERTGWVQNLRYRYLRRRRQTIKAHLQPGRNVHDRLRAVACFGSTCVGVACVWVVTNARRMFATTIVRPTMLRPLSSQFFHAVGCGGFPPVAHGGFPAVAHGRFPTVVRF